MNRRSALALAALALGGCAAPLDVWRARSDESLRSGVCWVHHLPMTKQVTAIQYGLVYGPFGATRDAQMFDFPFAFQRVPGGCVLPVEGPWAMEIFVCSGCDRAKAQWISRHPSDQWAQWWKQELEANHPPAPPSGLAPSRG